MSKTDKAANRLRIRAEQALKALHQPTTGDNNLELETIFQELQIHQIELEMQNDELRLVNEQLELQQLKLLSIYDLAPVGYFIINEAGVIKEVNTAGYTALQAGGKAAIINKLLQKFVSAEHKDQFYLFLTRIRNNEKRQSIQLKMVSANGHKFDAQLEGIAVQANQSTQLQYYVAIVDISESINAKQHLLETSERLELALQASGASIWELDIETMKFRSEELDNLSNEDQPLFRQTYASFLELVHPDEREEVDSHFQTAIKQRQEVDIICRISIGANIYSYYTITGHTVTRNGADNCMVGIMMDITERKRLEEETAQLKHDQQKRLAIAMINGQENASKRISDALHDGVSQLLYGIKMKLATLPVERANNEILAGVNDMLNMAINETRNISFELAPSILTDFGLPATIEELAKRLSNPGMKIKTCISGYSDRLDLSLETGIFRIIQELINNCMKHSGASQVLVEIKKAGNISIMVKDNGKGFTVSTEENKPHGAGLSSIRNRVNLYNGSMHIDTGTGKGTAVHIQLPHLA